MFLKSLMRLAVLAALAAPAFLLPAAPAAAGECRSQVQCPCCKNYTCRLTCEKEKEKHHCWEVECKPICIPQVNLPWKKCCEPKCAFLRTVRVLKKGEYECEHCRHKWSPVEVDCCGVEVKSEEKSEEKSQEKSPEKSPEKKSAGAALPQFHGADFPQVAPLPDAAPHDDRSRSDEDPRAARRGGPLPVRVTTAGGGTQAAPTLRLVTQRREPGAEAVSPPAASAPPQTRPLFFRIFRR